MGRPKQDACRYGHSLTDQSNIYVDNNGERHCKRCQADRQAARSHSRESALKVSQNVIEKLSRIDQLRRDFDQTKVEYEANPHDKWISLRYGQLEQQLRSYEQREKRELEKQAAKAARQMLLAQVKTYKSPDRGDWEILLVEQHPYCPECGGFGQGGHSQHKTRGFTERLGDYGCECTLCGHHYQLTRAMEGNGNGKTKTAKADSTQSS